MASRVYRYQNNFLALPEAGQLGNEFDCIKISIRLLFRLVEGVAEAEETGKIMLVVKKKTKSDS